MSADLTLPLGETCNLSVIRCKAPSNKIRAFANPVNTTRWFVADWTVGGSQANWKELVIEGSGLFDTFNRGDVLPIGNTTASIEITSVSQITRSGFYYMIAGHPSSNVTAAPEVPAALRGVGSVFATVSNTSPKKVYALAIAEGNTGHTWVRAWISTFTLGASSAVWHQFPVKDDELFSKLLKTNGTGASNSVGSTSITALSQIRSSGFYFIAANADSVYRPAGTASQSASIIAVSLSGTPNGGNRGENPNNPKGFRLIYLSGTRVFVGTLDTSSNITNGSSVVSQDSWRELAPIYSPNFLGIVTVPVPV
jgi:hypothetical protein